MSSLRRGAAAALVVLAAASALSACGDNSNSESDYGPVSNVEYAPVDGINLDSTYIQVRNLYLLAAEGVIPPRIRMTMVNVSDTTDALVGATVGVPTVNGRLIGGRLGTVPVVAGTTVAVGSSGGPEITFRGLDAKAGTYVPVALLFRSGRAVAGSMLVQNAVSEYSDGTLPTGVPSVQRQRAALEAAIKARLEAAKEGARSSAEAGAPSGEATAAPEATASAAPTE